MHRLAGWPMRGAGIVHHCTLALRTLLTGERGSVRLVQRRAACPSGSPRQMRSARWRAASVGGGGGFEGCVRWGTAPHLWGAPSGLHPLGMTDGCVYVEAGGGTANKEEGHSKAGEATRTAGTGNQNGADGRACAWEAATIKGMAWPASPVATGCQGNPCSTGIRWGVSPTAQMGCLRNRSGSKSGADQP